MNGYRLLRRLAIFLVIAGGLLLLSGCQGLAGGSNSGGTVGLGSGSLNFGSVPIGSSKTLSDTISNNTSSAVTISSIQGLGSGFQVTGITTPLSLAAGQTASFNVQFQPTAAGDPTVTISFDGPNAQPYASLSASATAVTLGQLSPSPSPVSFGNVSVGSNQTSTVTLQNSGGTSLTITSATLSGAGFSMSNLAVPLTLNPGTSTSVTITFAPTTVGSFSGGITFATTSNQTNSTVVLNLSGTGITPGTLSPNPASLAFGSVQVGSNSSKSETLTNTGTATVTISQATPSGAGFSVSGLNLPVTLAANQSVTFTAAFAPTSAGAVSGTLSVVSNASNSPLSIPLSGTGLTPGTLTANPTSVNFGSVTVGTNQSVSVTVTNTGEESVTVSSAAASGSGFSFTGPSLPITLSAGQGTTFNATFAPSAAGAASGTLTISSNASNPTLSVPLSGTGIAQGALTANPTSLAFGSVQVGNSKSLSETLTNTGGSSVTITQASSSAAAFSISGLNLPLTLTPNQSATFTAIFTPTS
ncbi:MAG: choice-of-anchor D domain-containing protein, partial [Terriglobales bacterium]